MVSAQVSSTSEDLYGSVPHLLHQLLRLLLGCQFSTLSNFFIACSNYLTPQIRSTYLGEQLNPLTKLHEDYTSHSSAVLLPHLPQEQLRSNSFCTSFTLLSDTSCGSVPPKPLPLTIYFF